MKAVCKKCSFEVSGKDRAELDTRFRPHFETYGHDSYVIVEYN